jgi:hypothetical protein
MKESINRCAPKSQQILITACRPVIRIMLNRAIPRIDRQRYPINAQNLIAEYQRASRNGAAGCSS